MGGTPDAPGARPAGPVAGGTPGRTAPGPDAGRPVAVPLRPGGVTMRDVARAVGVSTSTVSVALSGRPGVGPERRALILEVARDLGYVPDRRASILRRSASGLVGVVYDVDQPFQATLLDPLYASATASGLRVALAGATPRHTGEECLEDLLGERCQAIIQIGVRPGADVLGDVSRTLPVIVLGRGADGPGVDSVVSDSRQAQEQAVGMLVDLGHRDITHVDAGEGSFSRQRSDAYTVAMDRAQLGRFVRIVPGGRRPADGVLAARRIVETDRRPTAVTCGNDECAAALARELQRLGLRVPEDVSVVGHDDAPVASDPLLPLSTVRQEVEEMARRAVELLLARIRSRMTVEAGSERQEVVPTTPVVRRTTAPPRSA